MAAAMAAATVGIWSSGGFSPGAPYLDFEMWAFAPRANRSRLRSGESRSRTDKMVL
jgi:hypothetical protein